MAMRFSQLQCMYVSLPLYSRLKSRILCSSNDNAKFASSGGDRSVFVWDVASGTTTRRLAGHMGKIHVVEFNEDASVVASGKLLNLLLVGHGHQTTLGSYDSTVRLWDLRCVFESCESDENNFHYSAQSRQAIQVLEEARDAVQTIHVGSTFITTGSVDGHVRTYDLRKGELRSDFIGRAWTSFYIVKWI